MDNERQITFKYLFSQEYNPVYCNGAYGGVSASGEIVANFFLERMPIPHSITNNIKEDGTLGESVSIIPDNLEESIIRYVSTGIVMNESGARSVYEWLGNQLKILDNQKAILKANAQESD